jgi:hypothetical protein
MRALWHTAAKPYQAAVINWLPRDLRSLANEARVPWDGLGHRLSWHRHRQARAAVVLTG